MSDDVNIAHAELEKSFSDQVLLTGFEETLKSFRFLFLFPFPFIISLSCNFILTVHMNFYLILSYRPSISVAEFQYCMECGVAVPTRLPSTKGKDGKRIKALKIPYTNKLEADVLAKLRNEGRSHYNFYEDNICQ